MSINQSVENRVKKLDDIENNVALALKSVSNALEEMSKDKPNDKAAEKEAQQFLQKLDRIESDITSQINHLIYKTLKISQERNFEFRPKFLKILKRAVFM